MAYAKLLNQLIEESGMTAKEVAQKCTEQGQKITASYISILRNETSNRVPSDELSRVLAKVLGQKEEKLVIEAYIDNAPEIIKKAFKSINKIIGVTGIQALGHNLSESQKEEFLNLCQQQPYSDVIYTLAENDGALEMQNNMITRHDDIDGQQINTTMQINLDYEVKDNAMSPIIKQGDKVKVKPFKEYNSGDIVAFRNKSDKEARYRKLLYKDKKILLIPFNPEFDIEEYKQGEVTIIGKVTQVCTDL